MKKRESMVRDWARRLSKEVKRLSMTLALIFLLLILFAGVVIVAYAIVLYGINNW